MDTTQKIPFYREDDNELLGFIVQDAIGWQAQTIFGYTISRTNSRQDAEKILHADGLSFLMGVWQYFDKDDQTWHPCVLKEVYERQVTVIRTNVMGYQDPDDYKLVVIDNPDENTLIKS